MMSTIRNRLLERDRRSQCSSVPSNALSRGRQRPVRDELAVRRRAGHRRPACVLQVHGHVGRREARPARDLHAEAVLAPDRQWLPCPCLAVAGRRTSSPTRRAARPVRARLQFYRRAHALMPRRSVPCQSDGEFLQAHQCAAYRSRARPGRPTR